MVEVAYKELAQPFLMNHHNHTTITREAADITNLLLELLLLQNTLIDDSNYQTSPQKGKFLQQKVSKSNSTILNKTCRIDLYV